MGDSVGDEVGDSAGVTVSAILVAPTVPVLASTPPFLSSFDSIGDKVGDSVAVPAILLAPTVLESTLPPFSSKMKKTATPIATNIITKKNTAVIKSTFCILHRRRSGFALL